MDDCDSRKRFAGEMPESKKMSSPKCRRNAGNCRGEKNCLHRNVSEMPGTAGIRKNVVAEMPGRTAPTFRRNAILENAFAEMPGTARIEKSSLPKCWHNAGNCQDEKTSSPKCREGLVCENNDKGSSRPKCWAWKSATCVCAFWFGSIAQPTKSN